MRRFITNYFLFLCFFSLLAAFQFQQEGQPTPTCRLDVSKECVSLVVKPLEFRPHSERSEAQGRKNESQRLQHQQPVDLESFRSYTDEEQDLDFHAAPQKQLFYQIQQLKLNNAIVQLLHLQSKNSLRTSHKLFIDFCVYRI